MDWAPNVFYSLESQTRPMYWHVAEPRRPIVHEIAHMWFGDSVSLELWPDIWLNEGLRDLVGVDLLGDDTDGPTAAAFFDALYATPEDSDGGRGSLVPRAERAARARRQMFHTPVYDRGAMTLQALREKVGDGAFFSMLRTWYAREPQRQRHDGRLHRARASGSAAGSSTTSSACGCSRRGGR